MHWTQRVESVDRSQLPNQERAFQCKNKGSSISSISNRKKLYYRKHNFVHKKTVHNRSEILFPIIKVVMCMLCDVFTLLLVMCTGKRMMITTKTSNTCTIQELCHCFCVLLLRSTTISNPLKHTKYQWAISHSCFNQEVDLNHQHYRL